MYWLLYAFTFNFLIDPCNKSVGWQVVASWEEDDIALRASPVCKVGHSGLEVSSSSPVQGAFHKPKPDRRCNRHQKNQMYLELIK